MAVKFHATGKQAFTSTPVYSVKAVKTFMGREGHGFECTLCKDGKKIGTVTDTADGGMIDFYLDEGEEKMLDAHCASLPREQWDTSKGLTKAQWDRVYPDGCKIKKDMFVSQLVDDFENDKRFKRMCKTKTLVKMTDSKEGEFSVYNLKFSPAVKQKLLDKFGNKIVEFVNERYL